MPEDAFGLVGHVIDGQFRVMDVAGAGGFGVVYRGQHLALREPIAIKCLKIKLENASPAVVAQFTQRFFDESRIMYRLSQGNLNVVRAITSGVTTAPKTGETVPYMVLEWLEGVSLAQELKERRTKQLPPPSLEEVIAMFEPAALAVAYAHDQGVVHRDLKPGNLFLQNTSEGRRMKVLDFGMAKVLDPQAMGGLESAETLAGVTVLSPQYVTPEQIDKKAGAIGPQTDVYAFALILVEALTNRRARDAETFVELMTQIARPDAMPTPRRRGVEVNDEVERVFARALARDPKARPATMGELWRALVAAARPRLDATIQTRSDTDDRTSVDVKVPAGAFVDFGKTMPLAVASPQKTPPRALAGTAPLQPNPEIMAARVAAIEAVRPSVPQPVPQAPPSAPRSSSPRPAPAPAPAPAPTPTRTRPRTRTPTRTRTPPPRASRALMAVLLVFVFASLGVSALLLARLYVR